MEEIGTDNPKYRNCKFYGTCSCACTLEKPSPWHPFTCLPDKYVCSTRPSLHEESFTWSSSKSISWLNFSIYTPYKVIPSIKKHFYVHVICNHTWFLEMTLVRTSVCVFACVSAPRLWKNHSHEMEAWITNEISPTAFQFTCYWYS